MMVCGFGCNDTDKKNTVRKYSYTLFGSSSSSPSLSNPFMEKKEKRISASAYH